MTSRLPRTIKVFLTVGDDAPHVARPGETMSWGNKAGGTYIDERFARGALMAMKYAIEAGDTERAIEAANSYLKDAKS